MTPVPSGTINKKMSLEEAINRHPELVTDNYYHDHLQRYYSYFSQEQILVLLYDDILKSPEEFIQRIFAFIGVDSKFTTPTIHKRINASSAPRTPWIGAVTVRASRFLRGFGMWSTLDWLKRSSLARRVVLKEVSADSDTHALNLGRETRQMLQDEWGAQISGIEELTGRSLDDWLEPSK